MARGTRNSLNTYYLAAPISIGAGSCTLTADPGAEMPTTETFSVNIGDLEATPASQEVIDCTRSGVTLTFVGTATKEHAAGDAVNLVFSQNDYDNFVQDADLTSAVSTHDAASTAHAAASNLIKTTGAQSKAGDFTLTNRLLHQNGSASAPAIAPSSDTDNGLYRVGANTLGISAAGSEVARASSTEFRVAADRVLRGTTLRVTQTIRYDTTAIPEMSGYAGAVIGDAMDATQTTIVIEELDAPPSGTTYPCAAVIDEGNAGEEWVIVHARDSGAEYTIQRGYPIGSGTGTTHSYGDTFRLVGDGSMQDANGNPDCHNFVISDIATTICFFSNALDPASGPQTIDLWLPPRLSVGAWAAPSDGKEFKFQFRDFTDHTIRFRDPVSGSIDELITGTGGGAITILYSQTAARYQAESSYT